MQAACGSFQALVNAAPTGATITIPPCTYNESVEVRKRLTINATGVVIDGQNVRDTGLEVHANDVTVTGLTVRRVRSDTHVGAVWTTGDISRFTFRNGKALDSSTVCISLNGGTGHRIISSEMAGCGKEGYFMNNVTGAVFDSNHIHHNNSAGAFDPGDEAGGGKTMASTGITFVRNHVHHNGGPGIWFDNNVRTAVVTNNKIHDNQTEGIYFEISSGAKISGNAVWNNGFGDPGWGFGAGITIASSDGAEVWGNTVAWNARGISVISQARGPSPHNNNYVHDNKIIQQGTSFVTGFYDDHGNTLFAAANNNRGSGNDYWVGGPEPSNDRFEWHGPKSRLSDYEATPGEHGGRYMTTAERNQALAAAGISGTPTPPAPTPPGKPVTAPQPSLRFRTGSQVASSGATPARIGWPALSGATAYQVQLRRAGGGWVNVSLPSARSLLANVVLANGASYETRLRARLSSGIWTGFRYGSVTTVRRLSETSAGPVWTGPWRRVARAGALGSYVRTSSTAGAAVTYRFYGRSIALLAPRFSTAGRALVTVDGRSWTVDLRSSSTQTRRIVFQTSWSAPGTHTIRVRVLGTAGRPRVDIDGFSILR